MPRAGPLRSIAALLAFACLASFAAALTGLPAYQAHQAAGARLEALDAVTAEAEMVMALLRRAEAQVAAAAQGDAQRLADVATTQVLVAEAMVRLTEGTAAEPALKAHAGAIGTLARLRVESLGGGETLAASPTGQAQLQASRLAAGQLAAAVAERGSVLRQAMLHHEQRLDMAETGLVAALTALAVAGLLGWQGSRADQRILREAQAALGLLHEDGPVGLGLLDPRLVFIGANPQLDRMLGGVLGRPLAEVAPVLAPLALAGPPASARIRPVLSAGSGSAPPPMRAASATFEVPASRAGGPPAHWFAGLRPVPGDHGRPVAWSLVVIDVSASVRAEAERETLIRELNHRVKNTFATVQSLAAQTLRTASQDVDRFGQDFMGRLMALARSHDLLSARGFGPISLADVAAVALDPFRAGGQVTIAGAATVTVRPAQAQALVVALFELGANAARHGALMRPEGRVTLRWDFCGDSSGGVRLLWTERGGPELAVPPDRRGFGRRLLERALPHDLGAGSSVTLRFDPAGLCCDIRFQPVALPERAAA